MTLEQERDILAMARRVLAEPSASHMRRQWADDVVLAIEHGDIAAARRIGMFELPAKAQRLAAAGQCPLCGEAHTLSQCPRWRAVRDEMAA